MRAKASNLLGKYFWYLKDGPTASISGTDAVWFDPEARVEDLLAAARKLSRGPMAIKPPNYFYLDTYQRINRKITKVEVKRYDIGEYLDYYFGRE